MVKVRVTLFSILLLFSISAFAQHAHLKQVKISYEGKLLESTILVKDSYSKYEMVIDNNGFLIQINFIPEAGSSKISYYNDLFPSLFIGKAKQIGNMVLEYHGETSIYAEKLKSINNSDLVYDNQNSNRYYRIADLVFEYYHYDLTGEDKGLVMKIGDVDLCFEEGNERKY